MDDVRNVLGVVAIASNTVSDVGAYMTNPGLPPSVRSHETGGLPVSRSDAMISRTQVTVTEDC